MSPFSGPCLTCEGTGAAYRSRNLDPRDPRYLDCPVCDGAGTVPLACPVLGCRGRIDDEGVCDRDRTHLMCIPCHDQAGLLRLRAPRAVGCVDCVAESAA